MDKKNKNYPKKENKSFWEQTLYSPKEENLDKKSNITTEEVTATQVIQTEEPSFDEYKVKVNHPCLRIRNLPSLNSEQIGLIMDKGIYTILEEQNGFGRIADGQWIMLSYTIKI